MRFPHFPFMLLLVTSEWCFHVSLSRSIYPISVPWYISNLFQNENKWLPEHQANEGIMNLANKEFNRWRISFQWYSVYSEFIWHLTSIEIQTLTYLGVSYSITALKKSFIAMFQLQRLHWTYSSRCYCKNICSILSHFFKLVWKWIFLCNV